MLLIVQICEAVVIMALMYDSLFTAFYNDVSSTEHSAVSFWAYVFKRYFNENHFFYDPQKPASEQDPLRRVDGKLSYVEKDTNGIMVLFFHEAKKRDLNETALMNDVEAQAFEACGTHLRSKPNLSHVYAVTTIGTRARVWKYMKPGAQSAIDSFPSGNLNAYIEASHQDSFRLRNAFIKMKQFLPSIPATASTTSQ